ncbi:MAG: transporter [Bacteroidales bacterium]|nr:transporter [Bacteroidales bacterium]
MKQNIKTLLLIIATIVGFTFHDFVAQFSSLTPTFLFLMLFFTFCSVDFREIRFRKEYILLIIYQVTVSMGVYLLVRQYDEILAQGVMLCVLAPTAVAAVVMSAMLGANVASVTSYSLLINLVISIVAPIYFSIMDVPDVIPFWTSVQSIILKIFPLLMVPMFLVFIIKKLSKKLSNGLKKMSSLSFYLWIVSATILMGNTMKFILLQDANNYLTIILLIASSLFLCLFQFVFGHYYGKQFNDASACSQYMGQKNTILAIWMAQTFLNPIASIAPAAYVLWQNFVNTYQLWRKK